MPVRILIPFVAALVAVTPTSVSRGVQSQPVREACRIEPGGRVTGASADICAHVVRRWALLVTAPPTPGVIQLAEREGFRGTFNPGDWLLESPLPKPDARNAGVVRKSDGLLRYFAEDLIPHEAGHKVFGSFIRDLTVAAADNYGSTAPDWLDEAPAVWMESESLRERRMRPVRGSTPSLTALVTMGHPGEEFVTGNFFNTTFQVAQRTVTPPCARCIWLADSLRKKYQVTDVRVDRNGRSETVTWYSDRNPTKDATIEEREFYALSYSLLRFIRLRGGPHAFGELIARYRTDPTPRVQALEGLPNLPASAGALEKAWHDFLKAPPAEDR